MSRNSQFVEFVDEGGDDNQATSRVWNKILFLIDIWIRGWSLIKSSSDILVQIRRAPEIATAGNRLIIRRWATCIGMWIWCDNQSFNVIVWIGTSSGLSGWVFVVFCRFFLGWSTTTTQTVQNLLAQKKIKGYLTQCLRLESTQPFTYKCAICQ